MSWIGDPARDPSFNAVASRRMPIISPGEIVKRPVWLTRDIVGDHTPPSSPWNKGIVRTWYNDQVEAWSAGAVFYKYRTPAAMCWNARIFCWISDDYKDLLDDFGADWLMTRDPGTTTPEHALRQLWGISPADV